MLSAADREAFERDLASADSFDRVYAGALAHIANIGRRTEEAASPSAPQGLSPLQRRVARQIAGDMHGSVHATLSAELAGLMAVFPHEIPRATVAEVEEIRRQAAALRNTLVAGGTDSGHAQALVELAAKILGSTSGEVVRLTDLVARWLGRTKRSDEAISLVAWLQQQVQVQVGRFNRVYARLAGTRAAISFRAGRLRQAVESQEESSNLYLLSGPRFDKPALAATHRLAEYAYEARMLELCHETYADLLVSARDLPPATAKQAYSALLETRLALVCLDLNRSQEAAEHAETALGLCASDDVPSALIGEVLVVRAQTKENTLDSDSAAALYVDALTKYTRDDRAHDHGALYGRLRLAAILSRAGKPAEAIPHLAANVRHFRRKSARHRHYVATLLDECATVRLNQGRLHSAVAFAERAVRVARPLSNEFVRDRLAFTANLGAAYLVALRVGAAQQLFERCLKMEESHGDHIPPHVRAGLLGNISLCLQLKDDGENAAAKKLEALSLVAGDEAKRLEDRLQRAAEFLRQLRDAPSGQANEDVMRMYRDPGSLLLSLPIRFPPALYRALAA